MQDFFIVSGLSLLSWLALALPQDALLLLKQDLLVEVHLVYSLDQVFLCVSSLGFVVLQRLRQLLDRVSGSSPSLLGLILFLGVELVGLDELLDVA